MSILSQLDINYIQLQHIHAMELWKMIKLKSWWRKKKAFFLWILERGPAQTESMGLPLRGDETEEKDLPFSLPAPSYLLIRATSRGVRGKAAIRSARRVWRRYQLLSARGHAVGRYFTELEKNMDLWIFVLCTQKFVDKAQSPSFFIFFLPFFPSPDSLRQMCSKDSTDKKLSVKQ